MIARTSPICAVVAVLALSSGSCRGPQAVTASINDAAGINGQLPRNPLGWNVITTSIDRSSSTISTLYGNNIAVQYARSNSQHDYPVGSVLSLVTWKEQEDPRWFGARIPGPVKSVEFVSISGVPANQTSPLYERYEGSPLAKTPTADADFNHARVTYVMSLRASVLP
jgi:hypothetical protein